MAAEPRPPGLRILGVLGGIGSGKSTVARALAGALSGPDSLLDADAEVTALLEQPATADRVEEVLGPGLRGPDGLLDRRSLGRRVFGDARARTALEGILHPAVRRRLHERLEALEAHPGAVWAVLDVPLLLEGGLYRVCDYLIFVEAGDEERARRAMERHGWSREDWAAREAAQMPLSEKRAAAHAILDNDTGLEGLLDRITELLEEIRSLPPKPLSHRWSHWSQDPA